MLPIVSIDKRSTTTTTTTTPNECCPAGDFRKNKKILLARFIGRRQQRRQRWLRLQLRLFNARWRKHLGSTLIDLERLSGRSVAAIKTPLQIPSKIPSPPSLLFKLHTIIKMIWPQGEQNAISRKEFIKFNWKIVHLFEWYKKIRVRLKNWRWNIQIIDY